MESGFESHKTSVCAEASVADGGGNSHVFVEKINVPACARYNTEKKSPNNVDFDLIGKAMSGQCWSLVNKQER